MRVYTVLSLFIPVIYNIKYIVHLTPNFKFEKVILTLFGKKEKLESSMIKTKKK